LKFEEMVKTMVGVYCSACLLLRRGRHAGLRVQGSGFAGLRVQGSVFGVRGSGFRVQGSGFRVQGSGFRVQGSGFRIWGLRPGSWGLGLVGKSVGVCCNAEPASRRSVVHTHNILVGVLPCLI
jgi:hypothetical protein